jgi:3',5'-cyclic AMP phosphodiesterase CpdA
MLRHSAAGLLAAGLWPGALAAADVGRGADFHFLVVNDIHYVDSGCGDWLQGVVRQMKALGPRIDFCLVVGDLAEHGKASELADVKAILRTLGTPIHVVIGNHDYASQSDRKAYEETFPGCLNYYFTHQDWQVIALDSSHGQRVEAAVQPESLNWLDATLPKLNQRKPTILMTHFPLGGWLPYRSTNADQVLERFKKFNLQAVFNGHFHSYSTRLAGSTILTTNRCCSYRKKNHDGTKEKAFFLCRASLGKIERQFTEVKAAVPAPKQP